MVGDADIPDLTLLFQITKCLPPLLDLRIVSYDSAIGSISEVLNSKDKIRQVTLAKELGELFRSNYSKAARLAGERK